MNKNHEHDLTLRKTWSNKVLRFFSLNTNLIKWLFKYDDLILRTNKENKIMENIEDEDHFQNRKISARKKNTTW